MEVEFQILAPLEVRIRGVPVAMGGPRQRALLAMVLLSASRVVSRDRLIDTLINGAPPATSSGCRESRYRVCVGRLTPATAGHRG
jgi:hypothetical protein